MLFGALSVSCTKARSRLQPLQTCQHDSPLRCELRYYACVAWPADCNFRYLLGIAHVKDRTYSAAHKLEVGPRVELLPPFLSIFHKARTASWLMRKIQRYDNLVLPTRNGEITLGFTPNLPRRTNHSPC